jgi:hypothetical protein
MTRPDPYPNPIDKKRLEKEAAEAWHDPLTGFGLGSGRLKGHGLGADRLEDHGLGAAHVQDTDGRGGMASRKQPARGVRRHRSAPPSPVPPLLVTPRSILDSNTKHAAPQLKPAQTAEMNAETITLDRRQLLGLLGGAVVLAFAAGALLSRPGPDRIQHRLTGGEPGREAQPGYKYVGDRKRRLYWPNESRYLQAIPEADLIFFPDDEALRNYPTYERGPL